MKKNNIQYDFSYIELTVKGPGNTKIYARDESNPACAGLTPPDEIQINNEESIRNPKMSQYLNKTENKVKLIWINKKINTIHCLFHLCKNIIYADFSHFNSTFVNSTNDLFNGCESLVSVNFNNFDSSNVEDIRFMLFFRCHSLKSIDLSNLDTSKVKDMQYLFSACYSLESINLSSKFTTSSITNMERMFTSCYSLISLDLNNFDTSNVLNMKNTFNNCHKLESLDLSKFDTSKVTTMAFMFYNCSKLNILDLSNFNTTEVQLMQNMFENCINLNKIKLSNFNTLKVTNFSCMFLNCESLKSIDLDNFITTNIVRMDNMFLNCISLTSINLSNFDSSNLVQIDSMFSGCLNLEYINLQKLIETNKINGIFDYVFENIPENVIICLDKEKAPNLTSLITQKSCYSIYCGDDWINHRKKVIQEGNNNYCEAICNEQNPFALIETQECVNFCDINLFFKKLCIYKYNMEVEENIEEENKNQEIKMQNKILENLEKGLTSEIYNISNIENGNDEVIKIGKLAITLTTIENQKKQNQENINTTLIDLGNCENLLREAYNLSDEQKIYMKKLDIDQEGYKIPYIKYDIYSKLNGNNLVKLNLTACKYTKVDIIIPLDISENLDKLNISSGYFNDICYKSKSNSGSDIILKDRREEFIEKNMTVCQDGCDFSYYNTIYKKVQCICEVKETSDNYTDMNIDAKKLL